MLAYYRISITTPNPKPPCLLSNRRITTRRIGFCCRASNNNGDNTKTHFNGSQNEEDNDKTKEGKKKKIVIVGSGWAALGAAHHLCKQQVLSYIFLSDEIFSLDSWCEKLEVYVWIFVWDSDLGFYFIFFFPRVLMLQFLVGKMILVALKMFVSKVIIISQW